MTGPPLYINTLYRRYIGHFKNYMIDRQYRRFRTKAMKKKEDGDESSLGLGDLPFELFERKRCPVRY